MNRIVKATDRDEHDARRRAGGFVGIGVAIAAALLALGFAPEAHAGQHLVRAGESWHDLAEKLDPGDEIILMPGEHRSATLDGVQGTPSHPIVIRGASPKNPPTIVASRYGLRLRNPRNVIIKDLVITGATINGIAVEPVPDGTGPDDMPQNITIENVRVQNTGPRGQRHAINIAHASVVRIQSCAVEGWAGSAIELLNVEDVKITECTLTGESDHVQVSGIRVRGLSRKVRIDRSRLIDCGDQAVCIGGNTREEDLPPLPTTASTAGSLFEASDVEITGCMLVGGRSTVAFVNCEQSAVRRCTIIRPTQVVVSIRNEQVDARFGTSRACRFDQNLIAWYQDDLTRLTHLGPSGELSAVALRENLWWTPNWLEVAEDLGPFPGTVSLPQQTTMDPELDEDFHPTNLSAGAFGASVFLK